MPHTLRNCLETEKPMESALNSVSLDWDVEISFPEIKYLVFA